MEAEAGHDVQAGASGAGAIKGKSKTTARGSRMPRW